MELKALSKEETIVLHLEEIRKRIIICLITLILTSALGFIFADKVRKLLLLPAGGIRLIYINPAEALTSNIRIAALVGIILGMPMFIGQFLAYILPALYRNEKKVFIPTVFSIFAVFITGVLFCYKIVFPFTIKFFLQFASPDLVPMFTVTEYLSFTIKFLLLFGLIFQIPLILLILGSINLINADLLVRLRKYVVVFLAVIAAIITPPDVISQLMILIPLWLLYEISILLIKLIQIRKRKG